MSARRPHARGSESLSAGAAWREFSLDAADCPQTADARAADEFDLFCAGWLASGPACSKCRGGFAFYRKAQEGVAACQSFCLSRGMDAAALARGGDCFCGATDANGPVWNNFPIPYHFPRQLLVERGPDRGSVRCGTRAWVFEGARELDGGVPRHFLRQDLRDFNYVSQVVLQSSLSALGDFEDDRPGSARQLARTEAAAQLLQTLQNRQPECSRLRGNNSPNARLRNSLFLDELLSSTPKGHFRVVASSFAEGDESDNNAAGAPFASTAVAASGGLCAGADEPHVCWDAAVGDTNNCGLGHLETVADQPAGACTFQQFEAAFQTSWCSAAPGPALLAQAPASAATNAKVCPITCGACRLYNRPAARAAQALPLWTYASPASPARTMIPFVFDSLSALPNDPVRQNLFLTAARNWSSVTCVDFVEVPESQVGANCLSLAPQSAPCYGYYVNVTVVLDEDTGAPAGCYSEDPAPTLGPPPQSTHICLGTCRDLSRLGSVVHELGHALGLLHEQARPDRDRFISVNWAALTPLGQSQYALNRYDFDGRDGEYAPYDLSSIMQYTPTQGVDAARFRQTGQGAFAVNASRPWALEPGVSPGQRDHLSRSDVAAVQAIYNCPGATHWNFADLKARAGSNSSG